jgi:hypothetical protein
MHGLLKFICRYIVKGIREPINIIAVTSCINIFESQYSDVCCTYTLLTFSRPGLLLKHFLGQITFVDKPVRRQPRDEIFPLLAYDLV